MKRYLKGLSGSSVLGSLRSIYKNRTFATRSPSMKKSIEAVRIIKIIFVIIGEAYPS
jgi:hypothetical protein